ncbi:hypothetical protein TNCV_2069391 [Trichonephila clavipes]|uniref:Uncharacterized protein n=1 Tax=Trichonephila clavipes TaxID=2585209 RepID=A0A8X7BE55_TRICX|nr:hypothetical protein TNCV_2069391 [Trichonephila clavipes]
MIRTRELHHPLQSEVDFEECHREENLSDVPVLLTILSMAQIRCMGLNKSTTIYFYQLTTTTCDPLTGSKSSRLRGVEVLRGGAQSDATPATCPGFKIMSSFANSSRVAPQCNINEHSLATKLNSVAQQPMRPWPSQGHFSTPDHWALMCMSRCPDQVGSLKRRNPQCLVPKQARYLFIDPLKG